MNDRHEEAVACMVEAITDAVLDECADGTGGLTISTQVVLESLIAAAAWFMAMNPNMTSRNARKLLAADVGRALSTMIVSAKAEHDAGGMTDLLKGATIQ
jgi:hypothetical protein